MKDLNINKIVEKFKREHSLSVEEYKALLDGYTPELAEDLADEAVRLREPIYGRDVFTRGLIEFTNYCKNDCYYCGIRKSNSDVNRYRLSEEEILECADEGYELDFRTFVLQGGEDPWVHR